MPTRSTTKTSLVNTTTPPSSVDSGAFAALLGNCVLPGWVFDAHSLMILAANDSACRAFGWRMDEYLRMSVAEFQPALDYPRLDQCFKVAKDHSERPIRWHQRHREGGVTEVEATWHEIVFAGIRCILLLCTGGPERAAMEQQLRDQASMLDLASDAIFVTDLSDRIRYANAQAVRLYGWSMEEFRDRQISVLFMINSAKFDDAWAELMEQGKWTGKSVHVTKDKREITINSRWTLIRDEFSRPKAILMMHSDITETTKLEAQFFRAQRLEALGTLASGIAHDLNNILSPIMMSVGLLRRSLGDSPDHGKMLKVIEASAERGAGIVRQVLMFGRGVEGEKVPLSPIHLVVEIGKIMAQTFPRNISTNAEHNPDIALILGDATQLHQVLLNLCVNARDAMPQGGRLILSVENSRVDDQFVKMNPGARVGEYVCFSVTDTGTGIPQDVMNKMFEPFYTTKEHGKGTGLGLATVMGIVQNHNGFLTVQTELQKGTTFRVYIPVSKDAAMPLSHVEEAPIPKGRGEWILVVDDEPAIREAVVATLHENNYRAYIAEDGTDGLALYFQRQSDIELVITDISMAQMDGVTLVRQLKRVNPAVCIVVASGHLSLESRRTLREMGVKGFLDKPYSADRLLRTIQTVLRSKRPYA